MWVNERRISRGRNTDVRMLRIEDRKMNDLLANSGRDTDDRIMEK